MTKDKVTLYSKLRSVKTEAEKFAILQEELKIQRERVAQEKKELQSKENSEKRKERNRHIYSLGVVLLQLFKTGKEAPKSAEEKTFNALCLSILENEKMLDDKDHVRAVEAIEYLGVKTFSKNSKRYAILKAAQKEHAKKMRASRTAKRKDAAEKDQG